MKIKERTAEYILKEYECEVCGKVYQTEFECKQCEIGHTCDHSVMVEFEFDRSEYTTEIIARCACKKKYHYRDFSDADEEQLGRMYAILSEQKK